MFAAFVSGLHFFILKPIVDESAFKVLIAEETSKLFKPAIDGDAKALEGLERFAHEDSMLAYLFLTSIYERKADKAAGININEPNQNFEAVDYSKSSNLILQAVRELDDADLLYVLTAYRGKFDPELQTKLTSKTDWDSIRSQNFARRETISSFDQPTKEKLLACHKKLKEKLPNELYKMLYNRSHGACLDNPVDLTPLKYWGFSAEMISQTVAVKSDDVK